MSVQGSEYRTSFKGKEYLFCSASCKQKFDLNPDKYVRQ
ncbi:MAG: YHS domain-containing protein [Thaumarchaeota archaeon]|nr:YHS domain-containing protein [Nitrososphaerota archaeon]